MLFALVSLCDHTVFVFLRSELSASICNVCLLCLQNCLRSIIGPHLFPILFAHEVLYINI